MANNVVEYFIRAKDETHRALGTASANISSFAKGVFQNLMNIKAGFDMAFGVIRTASNAFYGAIKEAFKFESQTIQFSVLMKSMTLAKERMAELARFAADTPFELNEIVKSSRTLHVFSDGAMGATESLNLVGDAASAIGQPIEELSFWVGRAYSMIKGGKPFGEAAMRLQEMGAITPQTRAEMEKLQASGASNIEVWGVLEKRLKEFKGGMNTLSKTGEGLTSTLKDNWTQAVREFGIAFSDSAKTGISTMIKALDDLNNSGAISSWGKSTADAVNSVVNAFTALKNSYFGEILGVALSNTFRVALNPFKAIRDAFVRDDEDAGGQFAEFENKPDLLEESKSGDKIAQDMAAARPEYTEEQIKQAKKTAEDVANATAEMNAGFRALEQDREKTFRDAEYEAEIESKRKTEEAYNKLVEGRLDALESAAEKELKIAREKGDAEIAIAQAIANAKANMEQRAKKGTIKGNVGALEQERQARKDNEKENERYIKRMEGMSKLKSLSPSQKAELEEFRRQMELRNKGAGGQAERDQIKLIQDGLKAQQEAVEQLKILNQGVKESLRVN
jgi:hypothetical protein